MNLDFLNHLNMFVRYVKMTSTSERFTTYRDDENVLTIIGGGSVMVTTDDGSHHLSKGDVMILPPFETHTMFVDSQEPLVEYIFHFDLFRRNSKNKPEHVLVPSEILVETTDADWSKKKKSARFLPEEEMIFRNFPKVFHLDSEAFLQVCGWFMEMQMEFTTRDAGWETVMRDRGELILTTVLRKTAVDAKSASISSDFRGSILAAIQYVNVYYSNKNLKIKDIADAAGYSENYFTSIFKKVTGMSLYQYITFIRIENAKYLLLRGISISEVAEMVGFSSTSVFHKVFKKVEGITPGDFTIRRK